MDAARKTGVLNDLREHIRRLERLAGPHRRAGRRAVLGLGVPALDRLWPEGGLPVAALHEAAGATPGGFAAATAFAAALAGRLGAPVLWCTAQPDFYGPGLAQVGLPAERLLVARARTAREVLAAMEEGLRHGGLGCVIGETGRLDLTSSRRLQLAAEAGGTMAIALRRARPRQGGLDPLAAASRWRVSVAPAAPPEGPWAGRGRWKIELLRARSGATGSWIIDIPDAQGHLHLSSPLADGGAAAAAGAGRRAAAG